MTTDDESDLAAEYVLGTLDADERADAASRVAADPEFAAEVAAWERRLGELNVMVGAVEPPAEVWERIKAELDGTERAEMRLPEVAARPPANDADGADVVLLRQRVTHWRIASVGFGALAAVLLAAVVTAALAPQALPPAVRPKPIEVVKTVEMVKTVATTVNSGRFVAVLQQNAAAPAFILTVDLAARSLVVRRVSAEPLPGKSYELWLVSTRLPAPRSLGLIGMAEFEPRETLATYDPSIIADAIFAVTVEPEGGSPTSAATGPVVFSGSLVEAVSPDNGR